jgi:hypothetical protein
MKLIYCPECLDMVKVRRLELRQCACGKSWGYYLDDDLTAEVGGQAVPIAVENDDLREAVLRRPKSGHGASVEARVLPEVYPTLRYRHQPDPRIQLQQKGESVAAPNDGPATPVGNSGVTEGPPSVS